ncbi:MAG TPA: coproporphyrinogen III oxidase, partial [Dongiaceae bacterium]|nr:coproporphyrinogen III oxidase [Dongiaceae bacterium]
GYRYIGMDHFAKPDDELAQAQTRGVLHRNFQGYTTCKEADLIGLGVSAISLIDNVYCQNTKSVSEYQVLLEQQRSPLLAGVALTHDDEIRRAVIMSFLCRNGLEPAVVEAAYGVDFCDYFRSELIQLEGFVDQGLLERDGRDYRLTPRGRLVVRKICMLFDVYLPDHLKQGRRFSRVL